jgi:ribosomal protein S18 acetylase RimI-like enzyme
VIDIRYARFPEDVTGLIEIWREYVSVPMVDLSYQGFETEFADLPGKYGQPDGCVLLAWMGRKIVGCIAMRKVDDQICEMKRLYVRPNAQNSGLGRRLVAQLIAEGRKRGYSEMRLDVLPEFEAALHLYLSCGFKAAAPVSHNPIHGTSFLGLAL